MVNLHSSVCLLAFICLSLSLSLAVRSERVLRARRGQKVGQRASGRDQGDSSAMRAPERAAGSLPAPSDAAARNAKGQGDARGRRQGGCDDDDGGGGGGGVGTVRCVFRDGIHRDTHLHCARRVARAAVVVVVVVGVVVGVVVAASAERGQVDDCHDAARADSRRARRCPRGCARGRARWRRRCQGTVSGGD